MTLADSTYIEIASIIKDEKLVEGNYLQDVDYISDSENQEAVDNRKDQLGKRLGSQESRK